MILSLVCAIVFASCSNSFTTDKSVSSDQKTTTDLAGTIWLVEQGGLAEYTLEFTANNEVKRINRSGSFSTGTYLLRGDKIDLNFSDPADVIVKGSYSGDTMSFNDTLFGGNVTFTKKK